MLLRLIFFGQFVTDLVFWHGNSVITNGLLLTLVDVRLERLVRFGCSASRQRCRSNLIDLNYAYTNSNSSIGSKVPFPAGSAAGLTGSAACQQRER